MHQSLRVLTSDHSCVHTRQMLHHVLTMMMTMMMIMMMMMMIRRVNALSTGPDLLLAGPCSENVRPLLYEYSPPLPANAFTRHAQ